MDRGCDTEALLPAVFTNAYHPSDTAQLPAAGAVILSVAPGRNAGLHIVYFGMQEPPPHVGSVTRTSFSPGVMTPGIIPYWQVDEGGPGGIVRGRPWSFGVREEGAEET